MQGARGDQILVQLPGVSDPEQAKRVIDRTAQLILKMVEDTAGTQEALLQSRGGKVPENLEMYRGESKGGGEAWYLVKREAVITSLRLALGTGTQPNFSPRSRS